MSQFFETKYRQSICAAGQQGDRIDLGVKTLDDCLNACHAVGPAKCREVEYQTHDGFDH